jgi:hypothetical protein
MAKKKTQDEKAKAEEEAKKLAIKRELFCQYYAKNRETFGNATMSYGYAFGYELDTLSHESEVDPETHESLGDSEYDLACNVCAVEGGKLLRNPQIDARITALLNELLKDEIVDSELAKLIRQDVEMPVKVRAIAEYNKLRGRIIDRTQNVNRLPFGETDLSVLIATLPQERQDHFYAIIESIIKEAELLRSAGTSQSGEAR